MTCPMSNENDLDRLSPSNREIALAWTLHEWVMHCYQTAHIPINEQRKEAFIYTLEILKHQVDGYLEKYGGDSNA